MIENLSKFREIVKVRIVQKAYLTSLVALTLTKRVLTLIDN